MRWKVLLFLSSHPGWAGVRQTLQEQPELLLLGETARRETALTAIKKHAPDLVITVLSPAGPAVF
ncbi:MAG: hypothetical protein ACR2PL_03750 [Dehalococcoidia bacterium]